MWLWWPWWWRWWGGYLRDGCWGERWGIGSVGWVHPAWVQPLRPGHGLRRDGRSPSNIFFPRRKICPEFDLEYIIWAGAGCHSES